MDPTSPIDVLIASTCYDLVDLRAELHQDLKRNEFVVRLSDDCDTAFGVDPTVDSVQSCLVNVEKCDAVVCIIDRRYGPCLPFGEHAGISVTHAEVRHASAVGKPIFTFIRDRAYAEYSQFRRDHQYQLKWVETKDSDLWLQMVSERVELTSEQKRSNWFDQFSDSVDLKEKVVKRLLSWFPQHTGALALRPERLVRLCFKFLESHTAGQIRGHFQNIGVGPAVTLRHGFEFLDVENDVHYDGGLMEGGSLSSSDKGVVYGTKNRAGNLFCEYQNRYGDHYKVESPVDTGYDNLIRPTGQERFYIGQRLDDGDVRWQLVT